MLLGPWDSKQSRDEYARVLSLLNADQKLPVTPTPPPVATLSVAELCLAYWRHAEAYYVKNGQPTSEQHVIRVPLRYVRQLFGNSPAKDFGPSALKQVRQKLIDHPITRKVKARDPETGKVQWERKLLQKGLARRTVNKLIARVKRMFGWAVAEELLPASVHDALLRVEGLRRSKGQRREKPRVKPVAADMVKATLPYLPPIVRAMVEVPALALAGEVDQPAPVGTGLLRGHRGRDRAQAARGLPALLSAPLASRLRCGPNAPGHRFSRRLVACLLSEITAKNGSRPAKPGRPRTSDEVRELVLRLARETGWGYTRLGELKKLGERKISRATVLNILRANGLEPGPKRGEGTWDEFLKRHASTLWACDYFSKRVWTPKGLVEMFVLFFIQVGSLRLHLAGITAQPDAVWMASRHATWLSCLGNKPTSHKCCCVITTPSSPSNLVSVRRIALLTAMA
jgi:hypothetical protein